MQRADLFKYKVDGCFLWSTGSWDILAVYPESNNSEGSYFDPVVAQIIDRHNSAAREAGHAFIAPTRDKKSSVRRFKSGIGLRLRPVDTAGEDAASGNGTGSASTGTGSGGGSGGSRVAGSHAASGQHPESDSSSERVTTLYSSSGSPLTGRRSHNSSTHVRGGASSRAGAAARDSAHDARGSGEGAVAASGQLRRRSPGALTAAAGDSAGDEGVGDADI